MKKKPKVTWPVYSKSGKTLIKDGTIDGVPMKEVWKACRRRTREWFRHKMKTDKKFRELMEDKDG